MAQTIVIEQGDKDLQDVTKITPDTRVNQKAVIKYPATDLNDGMTAETWTEKDAAGEDVTFQNPDTIQLPEEESSESNESTPNQS